MKPKNLIPLLSLAVIWGTYYVASNKAVESMSVFNVGIIIRLLTMLFLTVIMLKKGELHTLLHTRGVRFRLFLIGLMGFLLDYTAFVGLQLSSSAGIGTALLKTDILFVNLISVILYRQHFNRREWLYTFVMLFGVLMVMGLGLSSLSQIDPSCLFFILSALFVSINAFLIKSVQRSPVNPVSNRVIAYYNNFITMLFFLATAAAMHTFDQFARIGSSRPLALALLIAGLGQTLVYIVYYYNLSHFPVWLVKVFLLFMPVVSSVISFVLFDEQLGGKQIAGMLVVLVGALGILIEQRRKEAAELANQMQPLYTRKEASNMNSEFRFWMPAHIRCGQGAARNMLDEIRGDSVLIISDPFLYQNGTAERIGNALTGKTVTYFSEIEPNPSTTSVDACAALARQAGAQTIVGLGGGSSLDVAKVVSCLTTNEGSIYDYYAGGTKQFAPRTTRLILIPTTAGTGSEVTNVGVFTDPRAGIKMPFVCGEFWADVALIDPEMTYTLPKGQTASTGMDAFCHAIEAYWNRESQPMCDYLAMGAMKAILENIRTAYAEPENAEARAAMIVSALTAGVAFSQTRTTGVHAVSFPLTTEFHANHGTACAITLPAFIRISTEMAAEKMQTLAQFLGYADVSALADGIEQLMVDMGMPVRLSQLGVTDADIEHIAAVGMGAAAQMQLTPATMTQETLCRLLRTIL